MGMTPKQERLLIDIVAIIVNVCIQASISAYFVLFMHSSVYTAFAAFAVNVAVVAAMQIIGSRILRNKRMRKEMEKHMTPKEVTQDDMIAMEVYNRG
jgi:hypothetical protein